MDFLPFIVSILVFLGFFYLFTLRKSKDAVSDRVKNIYTQQAASQQQQQLEEIAHLRDPLANRSALTDLMEQILQLLGTDINSHEKDLQLKLMQAGIRSRSAVVTYVFMRKIGWIFPVLLGLAFIFSDAVGMAKVLNMAAGIFIIVVGAFGMNIYLANKKQKRQEVLQKSFPDTLDLLLVCVESGLALDAALSKVCKELEMAHPEMTKELNVTRMELTLLNDRSRALQNLSERTDLMPFRSLVAALLQTERFGTSLTETLRVLSEDYRHTRLMIAENKAGRLPALITIPLVTLILPAFIGIIMGPTVIEVIRIFGDK
jgi:tight adherence protein C